VSGFHNCVRTAKPTSRTCRLYREILPLLADHVARGQPAGSLRGGRSSRVSQARQYAAAAKDA